MLRSELSIIFNAKSIAVIGASPNISKIGGMVLDRLIKAGFKGKIYPVNPKYNEIRGLKAYHSVREIKEKVDLAVIAVPAKAVIGVIDELGEKNINVAVILSAGFSESGNKRLEEELLAHARKNNVRVIGPNCAGISIPHIGLHASFEELFRPGNIALLGQSGAYLTALAAVLSERGVGVSAFLSLGNRVDVTEEELLRELSYHDETKVVALYIEGLRREQGRRLIFEGRKIVGSKPVVVHKAGQTEAGARAALSHTGSLAGSIELYLAAFKQAGFIVVDDLDLMADTVEALAWNNNLPDPEKPPVILTNSGGHGVTIADHLERLGVRVPPLPEKLKNKVKSELPPHASVSNPIDMLAEGNEEKYEKLLSILLEDASTGSIIVIHNPPPLVNAKNIARVIVDVWNKYNREKPLVAFLAGFNVTDAIRVLRENKVPVASTHRGTAYAVKALYEYARIRKQF